MRYLLGYIFQLSVVVWQTIPIFGGLKQWFIISFDPGDWWDGSPAGLTRSRRWLLRSESSGKWAYRGFSAGGPRPLCLEHFHKVSMGFLTAQLQKPHIITSTTFCCLKQIMRPARYKERRKRFYLLMRGVANSHCKRPASWEVGLQPSLQPIYHSI